MFDKRYNKNNQFIQDRSCKDPSAKNDEVDRSTRTREVKRNQLARRQAKGSTFTQVKGAEI